MAWSNSRSSCFHRWDRWPILVAVATGCSTLNTHCCSLWLWHSSEKSLTFFTFFWKEARSYAPRRASDACFSCVRFSETPSGNRDKLKKYIFIYTARITFFVVWGGQDDGWKRCCFPLRSWLRRELLGDFTGAFSDHLEENTVRETCCFNTFDGASF